MPFSRGCSQPRDQPAAPALQVVYVLLSHQGTPILYLLSTNNNSMSGCHYYLHFIFF